MSPTGYCSASSDDSSRDDYDDEDSQTLGNSSFTKGTSKTIDDDDNSHTSSSKDGDSPETLVKRENYFLHVTRIVVLVVLAGAAAATSILAHHFVSQAEQTSFEVGFDAVATKVVESMKADAALKFWMARSLANTLTLAMQMSNQDATHLHMPPATWERITQEARFTGNANLVAWGPILYNDTQRQAFEAHSQTQEFTVGANPVCYVCGEERRGYINADDMVDLTGFGTYACGFIELAGRTGITPEENCQSIAKASEAGGCQCGDLPEDLELPTNKLEVPDKVFRIQDEDDAVLESFAVDAPSDSGPYNPMWAVTVLEVAQVPLMYDQFSEGARARALHSMLKTEMPVISEIVTREGYFYEKYGGFVGDTSSFLYYPVFDSSDTYIVGSLTLEMLWSTFMTGIFPPQSDLVDVVVETSCDRQNHTFKINPSSNSFVFVAQGDHHNPQFGDKVRMTTFAEYEEIVNFAAPRAKDQSELDYCRYRYMVFATQELQDQYITNDPVLYAVVCVGIFLFTSLVFVIYDIIVHIRQTKVMKAATRTNDLVTTLFPKEFRHRLYEAQEAEKQKKKVKHLSTSILPSKMHMQSFLTGDEINQDETLLTSEPIADLFPHCTVMFLDIAGFTAWSGERDPHSVFKLLETVYAAFDEVARSLGVFKVETIGDTYVAVAGLPQPRHNHAVVMAQFARHCLRRMAAITKQLERYLGPSTDELKARIGLHSGPVTAGVLRGEKARFQLFGSTVNTAARLESTGKANRIHCSQATRDLLVASGKESWVQAREDNIHLKGIGEVESYWVMPRASAARAGSNSGGSRSSSQEIMQDDAVAVAAAERIQSNQRLVDWNVEVLYSLLENVVAHRQCTQQQQQEGAAACSSSSNLNSPEQEGDLVLAEQELMQSMDGRIVMDELSQVLEMPDFDPKTTAALAAEEAISCNSIDPRVKEQLHAYVTVIADLYRADVPFHNFQHASHVCMSAQKLMQRIMRPEGIDYDQVIISDEADDEEAKEVAIAREIHEATLGMSSDPVMQFAVVFSSLIHDVDHTGLTNAELLEMGANISTLYRGRSIAEQHSVDLAWNVLMNDKYKDLRACIYTNKKELCRFRQLVVNAVIATDIADKKLKENRQKRWDEAFNNNDSSHEEKEKPLMGNNSDSKTSSSFERRRLETDRRATITFEYIIQASDIAHTMQHWLTYQKFNGRLFEERYLAWIHGHAGSQDPSVFWFKGEIGFFEFYIIPLAKKLDKCGVFGVSHHEFLHNAQENKNEWIKKGQQVTAELLAKCQAKYGSEIIHSPKPAATEEV